MKLKALSLGVVAVVALFTVALYANPTAASARTGEQEIELQSIDLQPGPFAPHSSGELAFSVSTSGTLSGNVEAQSLPALGAHAFYVFWFVRTDTGDKAFLGPVIHQDSIFLMKASDGDMQFTAPAFTTGPHAGSPISLGASGNNFFVLIAENQIDTFVPHPVSAPPSSFALMTTI